MDTIGKSPANDKAALHGVIDSIEEEWAVVVLDDGQRIDWPCERLPAGARSGAAVVLNLEPAELSTADVRGVWTGVIGLQVQLDRIQVRLGDQCLHWPAAPFKTLAVDETVAVRMTVDEGDTARRRKHVQSLIDDLFA